MKRPFDLDHFTRLVRAEQQAHAAYMDACRALDSEASNGNGDANGRGGDKDAPTKRLRRAEQIWHEAHFSRLSYEH